MSRDSNPLPAFDEPPVIETLLGVQFAPLARLSASHLGLYWGQIRKAYPTAELKPPLGPAVEQFGQQVPRPLEIGVEIVSEPPLRIWFINESSTQLLQIQKDRFLRNWRRMKPEDVYPHYDTLKPKFVHEWDQFCDFLKGERVGVPQIDLCEVTYINHIPLGLGWETFGQAHKVVSVVKPRGNEGFLPEPEMVQMNSNYVMGDKQGRLYVGLQPALRNYDAREVLQLTLTARGKPASSALEDVLAWFDMGHEWIVRGFADFTTPEMHARWRRTT